MQVVSFLILISSILFCTKALKAPSVFIKSSLKRITHNPLPKLYVYDHCPFCVRVRLALGLKNIKYEVHFMGMILCIYVYFHLRLYV